MNNELTYGALFAGYGGLEMGVQSVLGGRTLWHADIEPGPSRILAHHWPDAPNLGDVTRVDWASVPPVDVITGGSPCQDLSSAGKRAGMRSGTRSGLWASMCDAVEIIRPRLVVWENVRGALSAGADSDLEQREGRVGGTGRPALRALGRLLGDLADIGYDARWVGLRASDVGAPHQRFRVFLFATPADANDRTRHMERARQESREGSSSSQDSDGAACGEWGLAAPGEKEDGRTWTDVGGRGRAHATDAMGDGLTRPRHSRTGWHGLENVGDVPADAAGARRAEGKDRRASGGDACPRARGSEPQRGCGKRTSDTATPDAERGGRDGRPPVAVGRQIERATAAGGGPRAVGTPDPARWGDYAGAIARWERVTGRVAPDATAPGRSGPRLSPSFVEWMMGLPAGHVTAPEIGLTRNEQLRALGNGVVPAQAAEATRWVFA